MMVASNTLPEIRTSAHGVEEEKIKLCDFLSSNYA